MPTRYLALVYCFASLLCSSLYARWSALEDSEVSLEKRLVTMDVKKDGTYTVVIEEQVQIRNEEGRARHGNFEMSYTPETTTVKVEEAKTVNGTQAIAVTENLIEDKAFASSANGFDAIHQLTLAYPSVATGSVLYRRLRLAVKKARFAGIFSTREVFGDRFFAAHTEYRVKSELPLFVEKNDPTSALEISNDNGRAIQIRLKKPVYTQAIEEKQPHLLPEQETWVVLSSTKDVSDLARSLETAYTAVLSEKLPALYEKILENAARESSDTAKINAVTSQLQESIRYLGDWRTIKGGYVPRPLEEVASTKFGDCKDYSAATAVLLRKLGFEAEVAWVYRGENNVPLPKLGFEGAFNHAIVWARKGGKVFWVDTTNTTSFAQGIYEDIAGREALVLRPQRATLESIPLGKPAESRYRREYQGRALKSGDMDLEASVLLTGRSAIPVTGISNRISKDAIRYAITQALSDDRLVVASEVPDYDLSSRIVRDITLKGKLRVKNALMKTSAGAALALEFESLRFLMDLDSRNRVSAVRLGAPAEQTSRFVLKNAVTVGKKPLGCEMIAPWLDTSLKVSQRKKDIVIESLVRLKRTHILPEEIRSVPFLQFQRKLQDCLYNTAVVFSPTNK